MLILTMIVQMNKNNEEVYQILSKQQMHHSPIEYKEHDNPDSISLNIIHPNFLLNLFNNNKKTNQNQNQIVFFYLENFQQIIVF